MILKITYRNKFPFLEKSFMQRIQYHQRAEIEK
jgi:hypothetical protein